MTKANPYLPLQILQAEVLPFLYNVKSEPAGYLTLTNLTLTPIPPFSLREKKRKKISEKERKENVYIIVYRYLKLRSFP